MLALIMIALISATTLQAGSRDLVVNLSHLNELYDPKTEGWWEFWSFGTVLGRVNLDDTARAAITYLNYYMNYGDPKALEYARHALNFVLKMQHEDGRFWLYVNDRDKWILENLGTGDWFGRAIHALGMGYMVFSKIDPAYAEKLYAAILKSRKYFRQITGLNTVSHIIMGLCYLYEAKKEAWIQDELRTLCLYLLSRQVSTREVTKNPDGFFDMWGYFEPVATYAPGTPVQALALASKTLGDDKLLDAAKLAAERLFVHVAIALDYMYSAETWYHWDWQPKQYPCPPIIPATIMKAYGLLTRMCQQPHEKEAFAIMAGLYASWFLGNNPHNTPMYNMEKGYVYDGMEIQGLNPNSGCEATEVTLDALIYVDKNALSEKYAFARDILKVAPVYVNEYTAEGKYESEYAEHYSAGHAFRLRSGDYVLINLTELGLTPNVYYKLALLVHRADAKLKVIINGEELQTTLKCPHTMYVPVATLCNVTKGTAKLVVTSGEALIDDILLVPSLEYKLIKVDDGEYLLLGLRLARGRCAITFSLKKTALTLDFDESGKLARILANATIKVERTAEDIIICNLREIVLNNCTVHMLIFPLASQPPAQTLKICAVIKQPEARPQKPQQPEQKSEAKPEKPKQETKPQQPTTPEAEERPPSVVPLPMIILLVTLATVAIIAILIRLHKKS